MNEYSTEISPIIDLEYAHLVKYGRAEDLKKYKDKHLKKDYSSSFAGFMDQMLQEHGLKRKDVAARSGLSADYLYKLLRGTKTTKERDYIIAICIAIGMTLSQTQHALELYGMVKLDERDLRDQLILIGLHDHSSIQVIDEWLEKQGFPYIKVSPDMESYTPCPVTDLSARRTTFGISRINLDECEEIERIIEAERSGLAPMDYDYWGIIGFKTPDEKTYYAEASFRSDGADFMVLDEKNYKLSRKWCQEQNEKLKAFYYKYPDFTVYTPYGIVIDESGEAAISEEITDLDELKQLEEYCLQRKEYLNIISDSSPVEITEEYDSLGAAAGSAFYEAFYELDKATDKKAIETLSRVDDTRYHDGGMRFGMNFDSTGMCSYLESFNNEQPERCEYYQVIQRGDGTMHYSASHRSCYMKIELGDAYNAYFGQCEPAEYFISTDNLDELLPKDERAYKIFEHLQWYLHKFMSDSLKNDEYAADDLEVFPGDEKLLDEEIHVLLNQTYSLQGENQYEKCIKLIEKALDDMDIQEKNGSTINYSCLKAVALYNLAQAYAEIENYNKYSEILERLYGLKDAVILQKKEVEDSFESLGAIGQAAIYLAHMSNDKEKAIEYATAAIEMLEPNCSNRMDYTALFNAYHLMALQIDSTDPEKAVEYYKKAVQVCRKYHLDKDEEFLDDVFTLYNNYAWVLWNMLGWDEAIIYYGKAIDHAQMCIYEELNTEQMLCNLEHAGKALYKLYTDSGRKDEAERLAQELKSYKIDLKNA